MSLESKIESLLFLSGRPMSVREISELTKEEAKAIEEAGEKLIQVYSASAEATADEKEKKTGLRIIKNGGSFQMVTAPENSALAQEFVKDETTGELSRPSLETLTIIAYRGPVSKIDLDRIRGINCSLILRNLLQRGLIDSREDKKRDTCYYTVTFDFLRFLGLNEITELPDFEKLSKDDTIDRILEDNPVKEDKDGAVALEAELDEAAEEMVAEIEEVEKEIEKVKAEEDEIDDDESAFANASPSAEATADNDGLADEDDEEEFDDEEEDEDEEDEDEEDEDDDDDDDEK